MKEVRFQTIDWMPAEAGRGISMEFRVGSFASSKAGRDQGCCYVIVGVEGDFVYLCDGRQKKLEAPKRKRKKHIQIIKRMVNGGLCEKLKGTGGKGFGGASFKAMDEEIKYEIKQYVKTGNLTSQTEETYVKK